MYSTYESILSEASLVSTNLQGWLEQFSGLGFPVQGVKASANHLICTAIFLHYYAVHTQASGRPSRALDLNTLEALISTI